MNHTPGPWQHNAIGTAEHELACAVWTADGNTPVCTTLFGPIAKHSNTAAERHANCALIAQAPALADALTWALDMIEDSLDPEHGAALAHARAVLAHARGEQ